MAALAFYERSARLYNFTLEMMWSTRGDVQALTPQAGRLQKGLHCREGGRPLYLRPAGTGSQAGTDPRGFADARSRDGGDGASS